MYTEISDNRKFAFMKATCNLMLYVGVPFSIRFRIVRGMLFIIL